MGARRGSNLAWWGGLASVGFWGCSAQMPSVANSMSPGVRGIHASVQGMEGARRFEEGGWAYTCRPLPDSVQASPKVTSCSEADLPLWRTKETPLRGSFATYVGDRARFGVDLGASGLVGGLRSEHLGLMGWLHLTGGQFRPGGVALAQRWNPDSDWRLGVYQYLAVNRYYRWSDYNGKKDALSTYLDGESVGAYGEVGVGFLVGYGVPAGISFETKLGKQWSTDKFRGYFGINLHLESLLPFPKLRKRSPES